MALKSGWFCYNASMFFSGTLRLRNLLVGVFALGFVWLAFTCVHNTNPVDHSSDGSMTCDMSTIVSLVTTTQDSAVLLLLLILGGFGFGLMVSNYPQSITNALKVWCRTAVVWVIISAFSHLLEMFRKGVIHPKLYRF